MKLISLDYKENEYKWMENLCTPVLEDGKKVRILADDITSKYPLICATWDADGEPWRVNYDGEPMREGRPRVYMKVLKDELSESDEYETYDDSYND